MFIQVVIIFILIAINAFFAAAELSIISLREIDLEKRASKGNKKAKQLIQVIEQPSNFLATIQVGVTLAGFFTSASAAIGLSKFFERTLSQSKVPFLIMFSSKISFIVITILISFVSLLFGELIPKRIALRKTELIAEKFIGTIRVVSILLRPIVVTLSKTSDFFINLLYGTEEYRKERITEEEIRMMINVGEEKGIFRKTEIEMINSIFEFDDTTVSDVMTPRPDIVALDLNSSFEETIKLITEEKYSRIPVYRENIDNVVGILYVKDIIDYMAERLDPKTFLLNNFIRTPFFVTEYKKIDVLLREMQKKSMHIGIVIDEYGTTAGVITIEDMLEEIVGNIFDEYDVMEEEISVKGENEYIVDAGLNMNELNELLDSDYSENYDTVSGLLLDSLGRFPKEGENIKIQNYIFTILEVDNMRIKKISIKKE